MLRTTETHSSSNHLKSRHPEFNPTIINDCGLMPRLLIECQYVLEEAGTAWPRFKRDPITFSRRLTAELVCALKSSFARQHLFSASVTALLLVFIAILAILFFDRRELEVRSAANQELLEVAVIDLSLHNPGIGNGRVGFRSGAGEGSKPQPARAHGGGGSGHGNLLAPPIGKIPQPSEFRAPIAARPKLNPVLPVAGVDIDVALWRDLPARNFGDPRSTLNTPSNGPGDGGAIGSGKGLGIGEGLGSGVGPGSDGNIGGGKKQLGGGGDGCGAGDGGRIGCGGKESVYAINQVTERAHVLSKPEPQYTEEARKREISGTVVLRVVFSSSGEVRNIRTIQSLPAGLTERAIAAAHQIKFIPARVDGRPVSTFMQLEYNFNLY
jgi:TonB family protein